MIAWGRREDIQRDVANLPDGWFVRFMGDDANRNDWRKLGPSKNSTVLFRSSAVLNKVEKGEF